MVREATTRTTTRSTLGDFAATGVLHLGGIVDPDAVGRMRDRLWAFMARAHGLSREDRATWPVGGRPTGFQALVRSDAFRDMASPALVAAAEEVVGEGCTENVRSWGPPLVAFPDRTRWNVPCEGWHVDVPAGDPRGWGVRAFLLLDRIEPRGGGTLVVCGSHLAAQRIARERGRPMKSSEVKKALVESEPWFAELLTGAGGKEREHLMGEAGRTRDGTWLRLIELTGEPGDVILMDLCALHAASPNVRPNPRLVIGQSLFARSAAG